MPMLRPAVIICGVLVLLLLGGGLTAGILHDVRTTQQLRWQSLQAMVNVLGTSDLVLTTEARYTRHPAVSDKVVVTMDQPGGLDHFPSTLVFQPLP